MGDVLILCYHAVSDDWPASLAVTEDRLERQLTHVLEQGYRGATFTQAVLDPPARRTVAVTFDDGFRSVFERALPLLSHLGVPGTAFVPTETIGRARAAWPGTDHWLDTEHEHELTPMSWDELGRLADAGWEVGSHSRTHPRLTGLGDDELAAELGGSREECEGRLGRPCRSLAYPFGDVDERVVRASRGAGYETAAALPLRLHRARPLRWPRVGIYSNDRFPRFEAKVARVSRYLIGADAGEWIVRARIRRRGGG